METKQYKKIEQANRSKRKFIREKSEEHSSKRIKDHKTIIMKNIYTHLTIHHQIYTRVIIHKHTYNK